MTETTRPAVLFVCVHNAGRSQMAAGYMRELSDGAVEVRSGGSEPGDQINPMAIQAMAEDLGILTIAEGIETEAQRDLMREIGIDWGQGYLWGKPEVDLPSAVSV